MAEYLLKKGKLFYEIAKFEEYKEPVAVYLFTERGCSCPSYSRSCKHVSILNVWKKAGELAGQVYNDSAELVTTLPVS